ncbi:hypothetical protein C8Q78DRAFT_783590 [Trametes maxima]|nr:hypothetical protein C8Q78DRAFT_783590 [Trametes maxima]
MMEEGEIVTEEAAGPGSNVEHSAHPSADSSGIAYSPALEWPGDSEPSPDLSLLVGTHSYSPPAGSTSPTSSLRLLVLRSSVLRRHQKLALLDGYSEIQIGRDVLPAGSVTPKIRLKELEVSKLHATIYWDQERSQWSIVDMGSKHGTFLQPMESPSVSPFAGSAPAQSVGGVVDERGTRLSPPRVASIPRMLRHLDRLTFGETTFVVHIHADAVPCAECSPQAGEEIPLFFTEAAGARKKRKLDEIVTPGHPDEAQTRDPRKALAVLKRSLLSSVPSATGAPSGSQRSQYVDRSARRRALHPDHPSTTSVTVERSNYPSLPISTVVAPPAPTPVSTPPTPLPSSNIGHRLLMKQGWQPGSALGDPAERKGGLVAPLQPQSTIGRAGLGASVRASNSTPAAQDGDWKDAGKRRRWAEFRSNDSVP